MTRPSWVVGAVLLLASGCSFALSGPDPKQPRGQEPKCDTEKNAVLGDALLATAAGVTTLAVGADSGGAAIIPAVLGAVFVGAAIHGNSVVNDCRAAKAEYIASLQAAPPIGDDSDERAVSAQRARLIRSPASPAATPAVPLAPPAAPPSDAPDATPAPVPTSAAAPAPAPQPPPAPPAQTWSAFWKEVH